MLVAQVSLLKQQNYFEFNFQFSPGWFTLLHPLPLRSCLHKQALELESQMKLYSLRAAPPPPPISFSRETALVNFISHLLIIPVSGHFTDCPFGI